MVTFRINAQDIPMEIDTGASLTIMSNETFQQLASKNIELVMKPFHGKLKTYTGEIIKPLGTVDTSVEYCAPSCHITWFCTHIIGKKLVARVYFELESHIRN